MTLFRFSGHKSRCNHKLLDPMNPDGSDITVKVSHPSMANPTVVIEHALLSELFEKLSKPQTHIRNIVYVFRTYGSITFKPTKAFFLNLEESDSPALSRPDVANKPFILHLCTGGWIAGANGRKLIVDSFTGSRFNQITCRHHPVDPISARVRPN